VTGIHDLLRSTWQISNEAIKQVSVFITEEQGRTIESTEQASYGASRKV
jgi:hypothetical protein